MIRTGTYCRTKVYRELGFETVGISVTMPRGVTVDRTIPELAPSGDLLRRYKNGAVSEDGYRAEYRAQLEALGPETVSRLINGNGRKVILLCWERAIDFCHRHILAEWLNEKAGGRRIVFEQEVFPRLF